MFRYMVTWWGVYGKSPDFRMCPELEDHDERPPESSKQGQKSLFCGFCNSGGGDTR